MQNGTGDDLTCAPGVIKVITARADLGVDNSTVFKGKRTIPWIDPFRIWIGRFPIKIGPFRILIGPFGVSVRSFVDLDQSFSL